MENALEREDLRLGQVCVAQDSPQCCNGGFPPGGIDEDETVYQLLPEIKKFQHLWVQKGKFSI